MKTEVVGKPGFQLVRVVLDPGESFVSEAGKMVRMTPNIDTDVTTRSKGEGGIMGGLKRMLGGDSFFFTKYTVNNQELGEIYLAPTLAGQVGNLNLDGSTRWVTTGGSYMASGPNIKTEPKWQGFKGMFSGESLVFVEAEGTGPLILDAFGVISPVAVDGSYTVDTGHVVAFESTLNYSIDKVGGSWLTSFLAGEGFVMNFTGKGRVLIQSHNRAEFGASLGPMLPER